MSAQEHVTRLTTPPHGEMIEMSLASEVNELAPFIGDPENIAPDRSIQSSRSSTSTLRSRDEKETSHGHD
jgi:hypothetical protein